MTSSTRAHLLVERHLFDTSQCCNKILRSLYPINANADIVTIDPFSPLERFTDSIPFLAFPHIDLNHEVQLLDRLSRLCHAEFFTTMGIIIANVFKLLATC
jgi:hypothetical protein